MALSGNQRTMSEIAMAVGGYWTISIGTELIRKALSSAVTYSMSAPLFITWYHCFCAVIACYILGELNIASIPKFEVKRGIALQIVPLSCVFMASIVFNNVCLRYVSVSFFSVARSTTIVSTAFLTFIMLGQRTSLPAIACCGVIVSGLFLGNELGMDWSLQVVAIGALSSVLSAMTVVYIKKMLLLVDEDPWRLVLYISLNNCMLFLPLIVLSGEHYIVLASLNFSLNFWVWMTATGVLGVLLSFAAFAQIKYTSPLTHCVSVHAASTTQAAIALSVYGNPVNIWSGISIVIVLLGSLCYTLVRRMEMMAGNHARPVNTEPQPLLPQT